MDSVILSLLPEYAGGCGPVTRTVESAATPEGRETVKGHPRRRAVAADNLLVQATEVENRR